MTIIKKINFKSAYEAKSLKKEVGTKTSINKRNGILINLCSFSCYKLKYFTYSECCYEKIEQKRRKKLVSLSILNFKSCLSIRWYVKIRNLYITKKFLHVLWFQDISEKNKQYKLLQHFICILLKWLNQFQSQETN